MGKQYDGNKYGYICMTCGNSIPYGVNKDGECKLCAKGLHGNIRHQISQKINKRQMKKNEFVNIDDTMILKEIRRTLGSHKGNF